jgi:acyl-CoA thioesterase FadM
MIPSIHQQPLILPRDRVSPRLVGRAAEAWRLGQELAIAHTTASGWPASRFRAEGTGFVISTVSALHLRELAADAELHGQTWLRDLRRGTLLRRELRICDAQGPLCRLTQGWVHVARGVDGAFHPARASAEALSQWLPAEEGELRRALGGEAPGPVELPDFEAIEEGPSWRWKVEVGWGMMDPNDHANHPLFLDWCEEALARRLAERGAAPAEVVPVAEQLRWKGEARAGELLLLKSRLIGRGPQGAAVLHQELVDAQGELRLAATLFRRLHGADLAALLQT